MREIWKYQLPLSGGRPTAIPMPVGASVLTVQEQDDWITLWVLVDPTAIRSPRSFVVVGTGHLFESNGARYVGTVQQGLYVWHVFEVACGAGQ